jgi:hypothetical protein
VLTPPYTHLLALLAIRLERHIGPRVTMSYENKDRDLDTPMEWGRDNELDRNTSKSRDPGPATMWAGAGEVGSENVDQVILEPKRLSMIRVVALTVIMILTYFLGVSAFTRASDKLMKRRYRHKQSLSMFPGCLKILISPNFKPNGWSRHIRWLTPVVYCFQVV